MGRWIAVGTTLQLAMVVAGHWVSAVARLFGPLGVTISFVVGVLWARRRAEGYGPAAVGGSIVGGVCALLGIVVSLALGDVNPGILLVGTLSSALTGALGGVAGHRFSTTSARGAA